MNVIIPTSLGGLAALAFGTAIIFTLFSFARKAALILAILGGMFVTGAVGTGLAAAVGAGVKGMSHASTALFGTSVPLLAFILIGAWFWHLLRKGGDGKVKKWLALAVAGCVGVIFGAIPIAAGLADGVAHTATTTVNSTLH